MRPETRHNRGVESEELTRWTLIRGAAEGSTTQRNAFALRYEGAVRAYLGARWKGSPLLDAVDDAVQDVFLECFKGALERADPTRKGGFRAYLYGLVRNVARRHEERLGKQREVPAASALERAAGEHNGQSLSDAFDRAWARGVVKAARRSQTGRAAELGAAAMRRVDLLRLRFVEGLPIRDIADRWHEDAAHLHHEYAKARREFKAALMEVVAFDRPGPKAAIEQECAHLLTLLK